MNKQLLDNIIKNLINNPCLYSYEGCVVPYNHYSFEEGFNNKKQLVLNNGYKISILVNEHLLIPNITTIYIWCNEISDYMYIKGSISINALKIQKHNTNEIKKQLLNKLLKNEVKKQYLNIV